jgi:tryptophan synthase alpha chain
VTHRIDRCFESAGAAGRKVLIPFMTAGDPDPAWTVGLMHALVDGGADLIELGVPFSDPMADGPVIQAASERAIARQVDLGNVLACVETFRRDNSDCPVVLMGYMNPVERFGFDAFTRAAEAAGVDGLLLVDCPPEEMPELQSAMARHGLYSIRLVAPTTTDARLASIAGRAEGFIYYVSFKGITGAGRLQTAELEAPVARIRAHSALPVAVGFGIKDASSAAAVAKSADAVVIGSALVELLSEASNEEEARARAKGFVASIRQALDNG